VGYFVERQATNESLHGLSFWRAESLSPKMIVKGNIMVSAKERI
jgi:hypothetical protein